MKDDDTRDGDTPHARDIGWKQFTVGIFDLVRWPVVVVVIVMLLRVPLERLLDAIAGAFRG